MKWRGKELRDGIVGLSLVTNVQLSIFTIFEIALKCVVLRRDQGWHSFFVHLKKISFFTARYLWIYYFIRGVSEVFIIVIFMICIIILYHISLTNNGVPLYFSDFGEKYFEYCRRLLFHLTELNENIFQMLQ